MEDNNNNNSDGLDCLSTEVSEEFKSDARQASQPNVILRRRDGNGIIVGQGLKTKGEAM